MVIYEYTHVFKCLIACATISTTMNTEIYANRNKDLNISNNGVPTHRSI